MADGDSNVKIYCRVRNTEQPKFVSGHWNIVLHGSTESRLMIENGINLKGAVWWLKYYVHTYPQFRFSIRHIGEVYDE